MDPTCQWVILLLMSLDQTKNRFVLSLLNQTETRVISSRPVQKIELGTSHLILTPNQMLP